MEEMLIEKVHQQTFLYENHVTRL